LRKALWIVMPATAAEALAIALADAMGRQWKSSVRIETVAASVQTGTFFAMPLIGSRDVHFSLACWW
jgi:hypothetical protein